MVALQHGGAAAPGRVAPESSEAPAAGTAQGLGVQGSTVDTDSARAAGNAKLIATAIAEAALLGIEARPLEGGGWVLRNARGGDIGTVSDPDALQAAVFGFGRAIADAREMVERLRGGAR